MKRVIINNTSSIKASTEIDSNVLYNLLSDAEGDIPIDLADEPDEFAELALKYIQKALVSRHGYTTEQVNDASVIEQIDEFIWDHEGDIW